MCRAIYNSNGGGYHTRVCRQYFLYSISYISTFYNNEDQIYKVEKFDSVFSTNKGPIGKENLICGEKFKTGCLRTQLEFFKV
jgi:hypothetical protein